MRDEKRQGLVFLSSLILHPSSLRSPDGVADASDPPKVWALVRIQVGILNCPRGVAEARDPAKVVGQVRLLAGTL